MSKDWITKEQVKVEDLNRDRLLEEYTKLLQDYTIVAEELESLRKFFTPTLPTTKRDGKEL